MSNSLQKNQDEKKTKIIIELVKYFGIGNSLARKICKVVGICQNQSFAELEVEQLEQIIASINKLKTGQELRKDLTNRLDVLVSIKTYRGIRRIKGYPIRGQRTHSNAKTSRKNKRVKNEQQTNF